LYSFSVNSFKTTNHFIFAASILNKKGNKIIRMQFDLKATDINSQARAGTITTDHGVIETPIFMPVGTVGTVR